MHACTVFVYHPSAMSHQRMSKHLLLVLQLMGVATIFLTSICPTINQVNNRHSCNQQHFYVFFIYCTDGIQLFHAESLLVLYARITTGCIHVQCGISVSCCCYSAFSVNGEKEGVTYYYNPCIKFSLKDCNEVAVSLNSVCCVFM